MTNNNQNEIPPLENNDAENSSTDKLTERYKDKNSGKNDKGGKKDCGSFNSSLPSLQDEKIAKRQEFWRDTLLRPVIIAVLLFIALNLLGIFKVPGWQAFIISSSIILAALRLSGVINPAWTLSAASFIALVPQYYFRSTYSVYMDLSAKWGTYPGDLWYCWNNYLSVGFPYPREYPAGIQMIFRFIHRIKPPDLTFEGYMLAISLFMALFGVLTTYIIYHLVQTTHKKSWKVWVFWILSPSFLWYGIYNVDFITVFTIMLAYYLFVEEEYYLSAAIIALGTAMKVFPVFFAPLFMFQCPKAELTEWMNKKIDSMSDILKKMLQGVFVHRYRIISFLVFVFIWLAFNIPFMAVDMEAWRYPYRWQIENNFAKSSHDGSIFWVVHHYLEKAERYANKNLEPQSFLGQLHKKAVPYRFHIGKISLLLYGLLYLWFLKKKWHLPFVRRCIGIVILFLLTDRIYSPQYNLYLLPFLALADYKFTSKFNGYMYLFLFYLMEIPNACHAIFLFKWREFTQVIPWIYPEPFPYTFQFYVLVKYLILIYMFYVNWTAPVDPDTSSWKDGSGKIKLALSEDKT